MTNYSHVRICQQSNMGKVVTTNTKATVRQS